MKKSFLLKTYDKTGTTFKHSIVLSKLMSTIQFDQNINGSQGELNIQISYDFFDTTFLQGDIIKVYEYDDNNKSGRLLYTGYVSIINRVGTTNSEYIELTCLGLGTLLNNIIVYLGSSYTPTLTQDPSDTIKNIIDYFNTKYGGSLLSYAGGNIDTFGTSISISYDYNNCFDAIKKVVEATNFWWYIDQTGEVYFKQIPVTPTHLFTFKKDVETIILKEDFEGMVNKLFVERNGGTYLTYQDVTSQTTYGLKEVVEHRTELQDATSQNSFGNSYISGYKNIKRNLQLTINSKYAIENIKPGDTISVRNINYSIVNIQVLKTSYNIDQDKMVLYLDRVITFGDMVVL